MFIKYAPERFGGEIFDFKGIEASYLSIIIKLNSTNCFLLLAGIAPSLFPRFSDAHHKFINMYLSIHRIACAGFHSFPNFVHKKPRCVFCNSVAYTHIASGQAFGTSGHLKAHEKSLAKAKLYLMEQSVRRSTLDIAANVANPRKILTLLTTTVYAFPAGVALLKLYIRKIFLAILIRFEPIAKF